MSLRLSPRVFALLGLAALPLPAACETAPGTGRSIFTGGMASFLSRLRAHGQFESEPRGEPGKADQFGILQTHPRTADRIARARRSRS